VASCDESGSRRVNSVPPSGGEATSTLPPCRSAARLTIDRPSPEPGSVRASLDFFVSISLMPISMAVAGPVSEAIGLRTTFLIAGTLPAVAAAVAIVAAKLPRDEIEHPIS